MTRERRSILKLEKVVKQAYAEDKSSDKMYTSLYDLISAIIVIKFIARNSIETDEIAHRLATDIYLRLNDGTGWSITSWTKYLWLRSKDYASKYVNETRGVEFSIDDIVDQDYYIRNNFTSMQKSLNYESNLIKRQELLDNIGLLFDKLINKYIRYESTHELYRDTVISVKSTIYLKLANQDMDKVTILSLFNYDKLDVDYIDTLSKIVILKLYSFLNNELVDDIDIDHLDTLYSISEYQLKDGASNVEL